MFTSNSKNDVNLTLREKNTVKSMNMERSTQESTKESLVFEEITLKQAYNKGA